MATPGQTEIIDHDETDIDIDEPEAPSPSAELVTSSLPVPSRRNITSISQLHMVMEDDIVLTNYAIDQMQIAWTEANHPDERCRIAMTQTNLLMARRKFLNMKCGPMAGKGSDRDNYED